MDPSAITPALALGLLAVLALSFLRHRRHRDDVVHETTPTVRSLMDDAKSYYGIDPTASGSRTASLLDAAPLELIAGVTEKGPQASSQPTGRGR